LRLFGLTGGIASGKSTVAARFRARGLPVIDADVLARQVVAPGTDGLQAVVAAFGRDVLGPDGALDRPALARRVFADTAARRTLEGITHPRISALGFAHAEEIATRGEPLACYEAALIVENGAADGFRPLVVVACPQDVQVARLQARGCSQDDALARVRAQKPLADKIAVADYVIDTTGTLQEGARRADAVLSDICARFGVDVGRYAPTREG
jgi:dephospho-CoA kinase